MCELCAQVPDALPVDDQRPSGVYKGIIAEDALSGTLRATIATDLSEGAAQISLGGQVHPATAFAITGAGPDPTFVFSSQRFSLSLQVSAGGQLIDQGLTFDGQDLEIVVAKELSDRLVRCFEGTWQGDGVAGIWNFIIRGEEIRGRYDGSGSGAYEGSLSGSQIDVDTLGGSDLATGTLRADEARGTWNFYGNTGTWQGRRTL